MDPAALKYAKSHEWVAVEGDVATIGITDFAVEQLTDLVYIELPEVGKEFAAGESFGVVESVKAVSDLYAPVSGEVVEINEALRDAPELLNSDPFGEGWIAKVDIADRSELDALLDADAYAAETA
jgi:glycine cleavage system H protein